MAITAFAGEKLLAIILSKSTESEFEQAETNRRQCVKVNDTPSSNMKCTMCIAQGLVLGPLLFSLYINNLTQQCHRIELQMYADGTRIYTHAKTAELAAVKLLWKGLCGGLINHVLV